MTPVEKWCYMQKVRRKHSQLESDVRRLNELVAWSPDGPYKTGLKRRLKRAELRLRRAKLGMGSDGGEKMTEDEKEALKEKLKEETRKAHAEWLEYDLKEVDRIIDGLEKLKKQREGG
jgi:hypothetical protein